jgi:hypothetical protein
VADFTLKLEKAPPSRLEALANMWLSTALKEATDSGHPVNSCKFVLWPRLERGSIGNIFLVTGVHLNALRAIYYPYREFFWKNEKGDFIIIHLSNEALDMELNGNRYLRLHAAQAGTAMSLDESVYCSRHALPPPPRAPTPAPAAYMPALGAGESSSSSSSAIPAGTPTDAHVPRIAEEEQDQ